MPTLHRLSRAERDILREAFRSAAWLEPSPTDRTDPDKAEWAAFEDDALFRLIPAFETILEARAAEEAQRPVGEPSAARQEKVRERLKDSPFTKDDTTRNADSSAESEEAPAPSQKPGESFSDFIADMAAPFVGEVAGFIATSGIAGTGARTSKSSTKPHPADLLTGLLPTVIDTVADLLDTKPAPGAHRDSGDGADGTDAGTSKRPGDR